MERKVNQKIVLVISDGQGYHYLHWVYQGQGHVSSGSNGGLQRMLSLFHSLNTPLPLQRWEATHTQELPLHLPIPGGSMWL